MAIDNYSLSPNWIHESNKEDIPQGLQQAQMELPNT